MWKLSPMLAKKKLQMRLTHFTSHCLKPQIAVTYVHWTTVPPITNPCSSFYFLYVSDASLQHRILKLLDFSFYSCIQEKKLISGFSLLFADNQSLHDDETVIFVTLFRVSLFLATHPTEFILCLLQQSSLFCVLWFTASHYSVWNASHIDRSLTRSFKSRKKKQKCYFYFAQLIDFSLRLPCCYNHCSLSSLSLFFVPPFLNSALINSY